MSKNKKVRKAKATAARRHPKNETPETIVIPNATSDQAANDATINTQDANDGVVLETDLDDPKPIVSYDTTGNGDDLLDAEAPEQPKRETNESLAQAMANQAALEGDGEAVDIAFSEMSLKFRDWVVGIPSALGKVLKKTHDSMVEGWMAFDTFAGKHITAFYSLCHYKRIEFYEWCKAQRVKFEERFPRNATVKDLMRLTGALSEVLGETTGENVKAIESLSARISVLENAVSRRNNPSLVEPAKLNDLLLMVHQGQNVKAVQAYRALTGVPLGAARDFIGSFQSCPA